MITPIGKRQNSSKALNRYHYRDAGLYDYSASADETQKYEMKIKSIESQANDYNNHRTKKIKITKSMLTKGKSLSFPKRYGQMFINIVMVNQKGEKIKYSIDLHR